MFRVALLVFLPLLLLARIPHQKDGGTAPTRADVPFEPWLTGPLLAPSATNAQPNHPSLLLNPTFLNTYGEYDDSWHYQNTEDVWSVALLVDLQVGITERIGFEVTGTLTTRFQKRDTDTELNDTIALLGYQIANDIKDSWVPDLRIAVQTIFPTGNHDQLGSEDRRALAVSGQGAFFVGPSLAFQKLFHFPHHLFMIHGGIGYNFPTRAKVRGFSVYGGGIGTDGTIRPGQFLNANLSGEYALNQHWALACDTFLLYQRPTSRFRGVRGTCPTGGPAQVGLPTSVQISITPSVEYSHSAQMGWLFGAWLTVAGRNASAFAGGFVAFSYIF